MSLTMKISLGCVEIRTISDYVYIYIYICIYIYIYMYYIYICIFVEHDWAALPCSNMGIQASK